MEGGVGEEPRSQFIQQEAEVTGEVEVSFNPLPCPLHFRGEGMWPEKTMITLSPRGGAGRGEGAGC